jgi:hypothetical protein
MAIRTTVRIGTTVVFSLCLGLAACGDDKEDEEEHEGHEPMSPSCVDLSEACREADTGTGRPAECHEIAHADVEADCAAELASCTTDCAAVM